MENFKSFFNLKLGKNMKKKLYFNRLNFKRFQRKLIVMRNTILILLFSAFQVLATGSYAQTKTISLSMKDAAIRDVLHAIQKQSEFYFLYNSELVDVAKKVDITIDEEKVDQVLTRLFSKDEVDFLIKDRYIVLTPVGGNAALLLEQQQPQRVVSGKVTDSGGVALPGVTVVVKGTTHGTATDLDGNYTLTNIPKDAILIFSFVGMRSQEVTVENETTINVSMVVDALMLDEVVATALGIRREKKSLGYSVGEVTADQINRVPQESAVNALVGRVSGLKVSNPSVDINSDPQIVIRGYMSLSGDDAPLIVIDGLPTGNNASVMSDLNANSIESVSVLKGPSAAALYGSRAGNGVILVTTKSGLNKGGIGVSINSSASALKPYRFLDFQSQFANGRHGEFDASQNGWWGPPMGTLAVQMVKKFHWLDIQII